MNTLVYKKEFPILNKNNKDRDDALHHFFREQFVVLFFSWKKADISCNPCPFSDSLLHVLQLLKKKLRESPSSTMWTQYLKLYYHWMAFTRDSKEGKGEHELTYCMITIWYRVFPVLAIYFVHQLADVYGSWRDLPYLCDHVYRTQGNNYKSGLIDYCVKYMIQQLKKDMSCIQTGKYEDISYLAKWIPREYKKFDWLYSICVIEWTKENYPHMLSRISCESAYQPVELIHSRKLANHFSSFYRAISKCKSMFRKSIALLNKILDTTEIKQCSQQEHLIDPRNVSKYTLSKQPFLFSTEKESHVFRKQIDTCREQFKEYYNDLYFESSPFPADISASPSKKITGISLPVSSYIKRAFQLIDLIESTGNVDSYSIRLLNKQWEIYSKQVLCKKTSSREPVIAFLDVSFFMQFNRVSDVNTDSEADTDAFYTAMGLAILVAQKSSLGKRIMAVDQFPTWIDFSESSNLIETVAIIRSRLLGNQRSFADFKKAFSMISIFMRCAKADVAPLRIVVFSRFTQDADYSFWLNPEEGELFHLIFWNIGRHGSEGLDRELPCSPFQKNKWLVSGNSPCFLKDVFRSVNDGIGMNTYELLIRKMFSNRYMQMSKYVDTCFTM
jgi:hypothetical protein